MGATTEPPRRPAPPEARLVLGNAQALVFVVEDPDAPRPTFCHEVPHNIPRQTATIAAGTPSDATLGDGGKAGEGGYNV